MPISDPRDGFFYPTLTLMTDSYSLSKPITDPRDGFFYPTLTLMTDSYSLSKPRDANQWSAGRIFLSYPHTHDRFLESQQASWCQSVILGTDFSILPSHSWQILIVSASLVMPISDPRDGFFYPTLTLMTDSYSLSKPRDANQWSSGRIFLSHPHTHDRFL